MTNRYPRLAFGWAAFTMFDSFGNKMTPARTALFSPLGKGGPKEDSYRWRDGEGSETDRKIALVHMQAKDDDPLAREVFAGRHAPHGQPDDGGRDKTSIVLHRKTSASSRIRLPPCIAPSKGGTKSVVVRMIERVFPFSW